MNLKLKDYNLKPKFGYSLVELIIVVGLTGFLAVGISSVVLFAIVNSTRIRNSVRTKQIGDYAIGQMQTMVRSATSVVSCDSSGESLTIANADGYETVFQLEVDGATSRIASNSGTFLTSSDLVVQNFDLTCEPSDTDVGLVSISFSLKKDQDNARAITNPELTFETAVEPRN